MHAKTLSFLAAALFGLCALRAPAQTAEDYSVSVPVADQGAAARDQALREALAIVIGRISGEAAVHGGKAMPVLDHAASLVQQYSYQQSAQDQLELLAAFDPQALDGALKNQGLPLWGVSAAAVDEVALSIAGVATPRDYAHVIAYLRGQPGVRSLAVSEVNGGLLHLRLHAEGGAERLAGAVSVGNVLKRQDSADPRELHFALAR